MVEEFWQGSAWAFMLWFDTGKKVRNKDFDLAGGQFSASIALGKDKKMDGVNRTLYIPLYGKAYVSRKGLFLDDAKAEEIWEKEGFELYLPELKWCGDNAAMIGSQAFYEYQKGKIAGAELNGYASMSIEED